MCCSSSSRKSAWLKGGSGRGSSAGNGPSPVQGVGLTKAERIGSYEGIFTESGAVRDESGRAASGCTSNYLQSTRGKAGAET